MSGAYLREGRPPTYEECLEEALAIYVRAWYDDHPEALLPLEDPS
ncbi:hypothetical protein [Microbacterium sp.]